MPFQEGNQLAKGEGRKGYEFEKEQLTAMREMLDKYLTIAARILDEEERPKDIKKIETLSGDMRKIMDKLHPSKQDNKMDLTSGGKPIPLFDYVRNNNSNPENTDTNKEN